VGALGPLWELDKLGQAQGAAVRIPSPEPDINRLGPCRARPGRRRNRAGTGCAFPSDQTWHKLFSAYAKFPLLSRLRPADLESPGPAAAPEALPLPHGGRDRRRPANPSPWAASRFPGPCGRCAPASHPAGALRAGAVGLRGAGAAEPADPERPSAARSGSADFLQESGFAGPSQDVPDRRRCRQALVPAGVGQDMGKQVGPLRSFWVEHNLISDRRGPLLSRIHIMRLRPPVGPGRRPPPAAVSGPYAQSCRGITRCPPAELKTPRRRRPRFHCAQITPGSSHSGP